MLLINTDLSPAHYLQR